ncbi:MULTISPECIES: ABC transporter permease [Virgibacillus]|uniref:ABC transporter permease n=1 Tax=Virgibacillus TaxID=84406 RepID=UPI00038856DC|nr:MULTISPECIES: ABC transporter permease [Virgibacillus]EQB35765.1 hypothetical protein M948_12040 [Virgibacillus sp. CM-4]
MKSILQTRIIFWKHQIFSLLFWLLLPIIAVISITLLSESIQEDSNIPVGLVIEEDTPMAENLKENINQAAMIHVDILDEDKALAQLEKHELDSVFIIRDGYQQQIKKGSRNQLITSYSSDLSFAYTPVSEMIASFVQEETGRSKAAYTVLNLAKTHYENHSWTWEEIVAKSKQIQMDQELLQTTFTYANSQSEETTNSILIWNTWGLWALFSILSTFFLFDWIIKEKRSSLRPRFAFIRYSFKTYCLQNLIIYTLLFLITDLIAILAFNIILGEGIHPTDVWNVFSFRLMMNSLVFLIAIRVTNLIFYYSLSFILTLIMTISSGVILPVERITNHFPLLEVIHPLQIFMDANVHHIWLYVTITLIVIWFLRKEKSNAYGK